MPENVYLAENEPTSATVSVNLANFITRTVLVDNIRVINSGDINVQILDEAIEITIMGDRGAVNRVKPENISVVIDYSSYTESTGTINASANVYFDVDEAHGIVYELGYYEVMVQPE